MKILANGFTLYEIQSGPGISPSAIVRAIHTPKPTKTVESVPKNTSRRSTSIAIESRLQTPIDRPRYWKLWYTKNKKLVKTCILARTWYTARQKAQVKYGPTANVLSIEYQSFGAK